MIKERCGEWCVIREDSYDNTFAKLQSLVAEAKRDFPDLNDSNIRVVVYDGDRIKRQMGIEFNRPNNSLIIDTYRLVHQLEYTLN